MIERFELNSEITPTLPSAHDFIIQKIELDEDNLIFYFEDDISYHDGMNINYPGIKSLVIKYHLTDDFDLYKQCDDYFNQFDIEDFINLTDIAFLYTYVSYNSLLIKLWNNGLFILDLNCDFVEYNWIEENI